MKSIKYVLKYVEIVSYFCLVFLVLGLVYYCYLNIMFFRNLSNSQSAACWVLCGVLAYAYNFLEEKEMNIDAPPQKGIS